MTLDDWLLAGHVLSAFALGAGIVLFWVLIAVVRRADTPDATIRLGPLSSLAEGAIGVGAIGTIVLGVSLAFSIGAYEIWDGWIVAAIVLWLATMGFGQRASAAYGPGVRKALELREAGQAGPSAELLSLNRTASGVALHALVTLMVLLILLDMIWKPGA
jgi:hypothetical protein